MHEAVLDVATIWILVLGAVCIAAIVVRPNPTLRIVLVELLTLLLVAVLIVEAASEGAAHLLDAAIAVGIVAFAVTVAAARFLDRGSIFK